MTIRYQNAENSAPFSIDKAPFYAPDLDPQTIQLQNSWPRVSHRRDSLESTYDVIVSAVTYSVVMPTKGREERQAEALISS